jgi:hypothetical protein
MDIKNLMIAIFMLIGGVFSIATSAIATQCYNSDGKGTDLKSASPNTFNFIIVNMVSAILVVLSAVAGIYFAATVPSF